MNRIRHYKKYKGVPIYRDLYARDEQVYIGNGQSCRTFWFKSILEAKKFINKFRDEMKVSSSGSVTGLIPIELCLNCKCHYSYGTEEWKKAKREFNCKDYKEQLKASVKNGQL